MKDIASKTDNVDELPANGFNSIVSELENTVTDSGQTLDGSAETDPDPSPVQLSRALTEASQSADFYTDSGAADAYVLTAAGNWRQSTAYRNGQHFRFIPTNANTGASTINISGLGVKTLENVNGTALNAGQLDPTRVALVYYNSSADRIKLIDPTFGQDSGGAVLSYITNFGAEAGVEGWATYADAAGVTPVDGTGGSPNVTLTRISGGSQLVGIGSFLFTKDAVNRQGEGFSNDFVIPKGYRNRPQKLSFIFEVATGTYTDGDLRVFLYDVDNSTLITPSVNNLSDFSTANLHKATFNLASPAAVNYRLIIHQASTTTNGYTIRFDQFIVINNEDETDVIGVKNYIANPDGKYGVENITVTSNISVARETTLSSLPEESKGYGVTVSASSAATDGTNYAQWDAKYPFDDADKNTAVLQAKVKATGGWKIVAWNTDTDEAASAESEELTQDGPVLLVVFPKVANTIVARFIPTTGSPADIIVSDITIAPKIASTGTIKTDPEDVSGTLTYSSDYGTLATENVFRQQDGSSYEYNGFITVGTVGGTDNIITLPFNIDTSKLPEAGSTLYIIPDSYIQKQETTGGFNSADYKGYWVVDSDTPNQIYFRFAPDSSTSIGGPIGVSSFMSSGQSFFFKFKVPVSGLGGSTLTATEAQLQTARASAYRNTSVQSLTGSTYNILAWNAIEASLTTIGITINTSTGTFTPDVDMWVDIHFSLSLDSSVTWTVALRQSTTVLRAVGSSVSESQAARTISYKLTGGVEYNLACSPSSTVNLNNDQTLSWIDIKRDSDRSAQTPGFPFDPIADKYRIYKPNKMQRKTVSSNVVSDITFLTFSNLVVGKIYKIQFNFTVSTNSSDNAVIVHADHDGASVLRQQALLTPGSGTAYTQMSFSRVFVATVTTLTIHTSSASGNAFVVADNTASGVSSYAVLTELNNAVESTDF
jgi:hypothetical protein